MEHQSLYLAGHSKIPLRTIRRHDAAPGEMDMKWDHIMEMWIEWFTEIGITDYTLIKRKAISREKEQLSEIILENSGE